MNKQLSKHPFMRKVYIKAKNGSFYIKLFNFTRDFLILDSNSIKIELNTNRWIIDLNKCGNFLGKKSVYILPEDSTASVIRNVAVSSNFWLNPIANIDK